MGLDFGNYEVPEPSQLCSTYLPDGWQQCCHHLFPVYLCPSHVPPISSLSGTFAGVIINSALLLSFSAKEPNKSGFLL